MPVNFAVEEYCTILLNRRYYSEKGVFLPSDWSIVHLISHFLSLFYEVCRRLCGYGHESVITTGLVSVWLFFCL